MANEFIRQLAEDVKNGHISEDRADQIEREHELAEHLESCRRDCEEAAGESTADFDQPTCELCGEPMPAGEEMFKFHGYSGPCPTPRRGA